MKLYAHLFFAAAAAAAPVIDASAYCRVGATVVQSDFDCSVQGTNSFINQDLTSELVNNVFTLNVSQELISRSYSDTGVRSGETIGSVKFSQALATNGAARPGYLLLGWTGISAGPGVGAWRIVMSVGPHHFTHPVGPEYFAWEPYRVNMPNVLNSWLLPMTIGAEVLISFDGRMSDLAPPISMAVTNELHINESLYISFVEADGSTLATLTDVPEPGTSALLALAVTLIAGRKLQLDRARASDPRIVVRRRR